MAKPVQPVTDGPVIRHILIVCVGNICRSPMAEAVLKHALAPRGITVASAGLGALVDYPADAHAVTLMQQRDLDITAHRAQQLNEALLAEADLVLVMEKAHKRAIEQNEPTARGKIYRLGEWQEQDIPDPYRRPREVFEAALDQIETAVASWLPKLPPVGARHARSHVVVDRRNRHPPISQTNKIQKENWKPKRGEAEFMSK
jgi:protein-tyrosine phosphatase